ncbi:hypothetical protein chiPu_0006531 [Chiloscyllium punctatum]|uniref:Uncharacterized protein n=1 Tax=Chiloscyllium punctatum TaxID=137246 RepID=A0A401SCI7_CHIPU|nr:hypothetical protein [Chiloscyllium punctatum]
MCLRKRYSNTPNFNEKLEQDLKRARRSSRCRRMRAPPQRNLHATIDQIHAVSVGAVAAAAPGKMKMSEDEEYLTMSSWKPYQIVSQVQNQQQKMCVHGLNPLTS